MKNSLQGAMTALITPFKNQKLDRMNFFRIFFINQLELFRDVKYRLQTPVRSHSHRHSPMGKGRKSSPSESQV